MTETAIHTPADAWFAFCVDKVNHDAARAKWAELKELRKRATAYLPKAMTKRIAASKQNVQKARELFGSNETVENLDLKALPPDEVAVIDSLPAILGQQEIPVAGVTFVECQGAVLRALAMWVEALAAAHLQEIAQLLAPVIETTGHIQIDTVGSTPEALVIFGNEAKRGARRLEIDLDELRRRDIFSAGDVDRMVEPDLLEGWLGRFEPKFSVKLPGVSNGK